MESSVKNIAISLLRISQKSPTGAFIYIQNLLDNIFEIDKENRYYLFLTSINNKYFKKRYKRYKNVEFKIIDIRHDLIFNPLKAFSKIIAKIKNSTPKKEKLLRKEVQDFVDKNNIDTFFFPSTIISPKEIKNVRTIITICDLQHEYFPENFSEQNLRQRKENYQYAVFNSDHIIAISDYTRKTIIEKYKIDPNKITAIHLGIGDVKNKTEYKCSISLPKDFLFYPAAFWPHKNHKILIEALGKLKNEFPDLKLVFTGFNKTIKNPKLRKEVEELIDFYKLSEKIIFLGYVLDQEMDCIYQKAKALVYPSSFEGFGLPILEAFKCGLPVIAADNTSISEVTGNAGLLFETNNLEIFVESIKKILLNQGLRETLITKGLSRVKNFSWENTAKKTLLLFNQVKVDIQ